MDFTPSPRGQDYHERMQAFMAECVFPAEAEYHAVRDEAVRAGDYTVPALVGQLQQHARDRGLWNLFLPSVSGLTNLEYSAVAELSGWSMELAPQAINCAAPDTGNMETLELFGTEEQKQRWLEPLLEGKIRSAFAMTEPAVASSDASNIETSIIREGDEWVINGRKWWISGAMDPRCEIFIVMGKTDPDGPKHRQQSMVLVSRNTPGVSVVRDLSVMGFTDQHGHAELLFEDVRVPVANVIAEPGDGFAIAQARLGPGRIHHCMRALGVAERALKLMCERVESRVAFGKPLATQGMVQEAIARSRVELDQARLLVQRAAWLIDERGSAAARNDIAAIKMVVPTVACAVIDRAIQVHGGAGVGPDTFLPKAYAWHRAMRLFDGPDEVHIRSVARAELAKA